MSKPLLFLITMGGTAGDRKPLAILSVLAAYASLSLHPVTLAYEAQSFKSFRFVEKLAKYLLGSQFRKRLKLHMLVTYEEYRIFTQPENLDAYCVFSQESSWMYAGYGILLDFGDNVGSNRFTSKLLTYPERLDSHYFGSLFLPDVGITWSHQLSLYEIQKFRDTNHAKKIMLLAGTMALPYSINHIVTWMSSITGNKNWCFLILDKLVFSYFRYKE